MAGIDDVLSFFGGDGGGYTLGTPGVDFQMPDVSAALPNFQMPDVAAALQGSPAPSSWLDVLSGYGQKILPLVKSGAGLASIGAGIYGMKQSGAQTELLKQHEQQLAKATAPATAAAKTLTPAGTQALLGGALPPELEATVQNWINQKKADVRAHFAHLGITDSIMMEQMDGWINLQAQELRGTLAQQLTGTGLAAAGTAAGGSAAGASLAGGQATAINQAIAQANQAVAQLLGAAG